MMDSPALARRRPIIAPRSCHWTRCLICLRRAMEPTLRSLLAKIHARRAVLRARIVAAGREYHRLEHALVQLDRQLCVMHGALDELDALVSDDTAPDAGALPVTGEE